jgi:hypothetical protein
MKEREEGKREGNIKQRNDNKKFKEISKKEEQGGRKGINSTEQSPFSEADGHSSFQENTYLYGTRITVHYHQ